MTPTRQLITRRGTIRLPAYFPVTTFGDRYPLDRLIRPYLGRLAPGVMVSYHYAKLIDEPLAVPLLVDSGGFASLAAGSRVVAERGLGVLEVCRDGRSERVHPRDVLELQEQVADVAFTLDFPVPPGTGQKEAKARQKQTIANALWAAANRRRKDLPLYACVQGWDARSARACAADYRGGGFDGIAVGGLVPRARDTAAVFGILDAVRDAIGDLPLHAFGLGSPSLVAELFRRGVDSVDSSSHVKLAAEGKLWSCPEVRVDDPSPLERLHLALYNLAAATQRALPLSVHPRLAPASLLPAGSPR